MKFLHRQQPGPIDDQLAEADIQDRLQLANTLRQRSMEGASLDNVGGHLVGSPWARALTSVAQGVQGAGERKRAYNMAEDLATSKRERLAQALGGAGQEPTPEARLKRGMELMGHPDPQAQAVGQYMAESAQKEIDQRQKDLNTQRGETNKDLRHMQDLYQRDQEGARRDAATRDAAKMRAEAIIARGPSAGSLPAATIQEINYLRSLDALPPDQREAKRNEFFAVKRAQQVVNQGNQQAVLQPGAAPGAVAATLPINLAPNQTAEHAGDVAREKVKGETEGKFEVSQQDVQPVLGEIEAIFNGTAEGQKAAPTGSGIGRLADTAGAAFGVSVSGAAEAERLNVLAARLTAKVPRMEGQQSNQDRDYYEMQAGRLGNASLPLETRKEAFREVKRIWQIKSQNPAAPVAPPGMVPAAPMAPPAAPAPVDYSHLSDEQLLQQLGGQP